MNCVFDASAILAFLQDEDGSDVVETALTQEPRCGAANWSEVAKQILSAKRDWNLARALLMSYGMLVEPVISDDAEWAARRWKRGEGLSLADRLCQALGERLDVKILTADKSWGASDRIIQIR